MRKFLSLVLALVMVMSLTTLTAGAKEFTDADSINYDEAVDVISALGVVDGYAGGEFGPSGILTRQAAAKIICNLVLGPTTARALSADTAPFPDVPTSSEFAGYIAYCANQGIIGGYPDGTFRPGGSLTGYAFMKMLLVALGYDASIEGFGGPNWSINVGKLAIGNGLDKGLLDGFDGAKAVNREEAALYSLNTLKATMVDYDNKITVTGQDGSIVNIGNNTAKEVEQGNVYKDNLNKDGLQFAERYFDDLKLDDTESDDFGRPANEWTLKSTKIGTYGKSADLVASYTGKVSRADMYSILSSSVRKDVEGVSNSDGANAARMRIWVNGVLTPVYMKTVSMGDVADDVSRPEHYYARNNSTAIYTSVTDSSRKGCLTEVYVQSVTEGSGTSAVKVNNVDVVIIDTWVYQATSDYSSSRDDVKMAPKGDTASTLTLKAGELTLNGEDFAITDIKSDDYLLITASNKDGAGFEVKTVAVAEKVEGDVTAWTDGDSVTIDGTKYSYSATCLKTNDGVRKTQYTVGQPAVVVMDAYGNVIAVDEAVASSSYVFIKAFGGTSGLNKKAVADAYFTDGTNEEISLDRVGSVKSSSTIASSEFNAAHKNTWYTYSINSDGKYVLYEVPSRYTPGTATKTVGGDKDNWLVQNGKVDFLTGPNTTGSALANDKTILVLVDKDGDVMTYTGTSAIPDVKGVTTSPVVYYLQDNDGYVDYAFVDLENSNAQIVDGGEDTSFMYVLRYDGENYAANATTYYTYKTIDDENGDEVVTKFDARIDAGKFDAVTSDGSHPYTLFYKPRYNSDEEITNVSEVTDGDGKYFDRPLSADTVSYGNGSLRMGGNTFIVNSSSKITLVARKGNEFMKDKTANHEITAVQAQTLESLLRDYVVTGSVTGCFVSDSSNVVDTMYVTIKSSAAYDFGDLTVMDRSDSALDNASAQTVDILRTPTAKAGDFTVTSPVDLTNVANADIFDGNVTVASSVDGDNTKWTMTWTPKDGKSGTCIVPVKVTKGGVTLTYNVAITVNMHEMTDAEKVQAAKNEIDGFSINAVEPEADNEGWDTATASAAALDAVKAAMTAGTTAKTMLDTNSASDDDGTKDGYKVAETTPVTDGTDTSTSGSNGTYTVTIFLKSGDESSSKDVAVTVKPVAFAKTTDGKTAQNTVSTEVAKVAATATGSKGASEGDNKTAATNAATAEVGKINANGGPAANVNATYEVKDYDAGDGTGDVTVVVTVTFTWKSTDVKATKDVTVTLS